jgi:hypothetical protein
MTVFENNYIHLILRFVPWAFVLVNSSNPSMYHVWLGRIEYEVVRDVITLALGSRPRQGFARVRGKRETGSVGECEDEHSHSQVNSHFGELESRWTLETSENDCKGQNSSP